MRCMYANLVLALKEKRIKRHLICKELNITRSSFYNKINGITEFTKPEFDFIYQNYLKDYDYWYLSEKKPPYNR